MSSGYPSEHMAMALHNYLQGKGQVSALTWSDRREGPENAPTWTSYAIIRGHQYGPGIGGTKQAARNAAAKLALDSIAK